MSDGYGQHKGPTNRDHILSGEATDQQMELETAIADLSHLLTTTIPSNVAHYAVAELKSAIRRYYDAPIIRTKDVPNA